jgi:hypothetical protein
MKKHYFSFDNKKGLRTGSYAYPGSGYVYTKEPVDHECLHINVLVGEQDLHHLCHLIHKVRHLELSFCDPATKRDLEPFTKLLKENEGQLETLLIYEQYENVGVRLKNKSMLLGKIDSFWIAGEKAQDYIPPKRKNPKYAHIVTLKTSKNEKITTYELRGSRIDPQIIDKIYQMSDESPIIFVQVIEFSPTDITYLATIFYTDYETSQWPKDQSMSEISKEECDLLLFQHFPVSKTPSYPKRYEDLYVPDTDNYIDIDEDANLISIRFAGVETSF